MELRFKVNHDFDYYDRETEIKYIHGSMLKWIFRDVSVQCETVKYFQMMLNTIEKK